MNDNVIKLVVDRLPTYPIDCPFSKHISGYGIACTLRRDVHCSLKYSGSCECLTTAEKIEDEAKTKQYFQQLLAKSNTIEIDDETAGITPGLLESED